MRNQVQLITYTDRLAGTLAGLRELLEGPMAGLFGGVHILPFFTPYDGADAGFDPADHTAVDPRLGSWDDVAALSRTVDTVADLIVNHVSVENAAFQDVLAHGDDSPYASMFLTYRSAFTDGATEEQLLRIYRPRPGLPFTAMRLGGVRRLVWTTFTDKQIDLDVRSPLSRQYLSGILETLSRAGVAMVRVDAVGYAVKTPSTPSFMTPETFAFIDELTAEAKGLGLDVLLEVHSHYQRQIEIARQVDRVYDFGLPPLVLHALHFGDAGPLRHWLDVRPLNCVTVLDTHDGIGVIDVGADATEPDHPGLLDPEQISALVEAMHEASGGTSRLATGAAASNLDLYQVNCTFYDALGRNDNRYLLARLIQFFAPGVPQVYYVGLLAGVNDLDLLARSSVGRDVNRHYYTPDEVLAALATPVVARLCEAIRLRNTHPAFGGSFSFGAGAYGSAGSGSAGSGSAGSGSPDSGSGSAGDLGDLGDPAGPGRIWMRWESGPHWAVLEAETGSARYAVSWTSEGGVQHATHT